MIKETGIVVAIFDGVVEVEVVRTSSCSACQAKAGCGHHAIAQVSSTNRMKLLVTDTFVSQIGQEVTIGIPENTLLTASFLMYLVPLLGLILGASLSAIFSDQPTVAAIGSVIGLGVGLLIAKKQSVKHQLDPDFQPRVLETKVLKPHIDTLSDINIIQV